MTLYFWDIEAHVVNDVPAGIIR